MYQTDNGFTYSSRAFKLLKCGLDRTGHVTVPDSLPDRSTPIGIIDENVADANQKVADLEQAMEWQIPTDEDKNKE